MPKRTHRQIRLDTIAEVKTNDEIKERAKNRYTVITRPKEKPLRREKKKVCCVDKYGDKLPSIFRRCPDCFRVDEMEQST